MLFALTAALLDASISAWDTKYQYVSVRPITGAGCMRPPVIQSCSRQHSSCSRTGTDTFLWLCAPWAAIRFLYDDTEVGTAGALLR
jgi:hypothetical protein